MESESLSIFVQMGDFTRIVKLLKAYIWIGVVCCACHIGLTFMSGYIICSRNIGLDWDLLAPIFFGVFTLMSLAITAGGLFWKIEYDEKGFTYTTFLKHKIRLEYADILQVKHKKSGIIIRTRNRRLYVDPFAIGIDEFLEFRAIHQP